MKKILKIAALAAVLALLALAGVAAKESAVLCGDCPQVTRPQETAVPGSVRGMATL